MPTGFYNDFWFEQGPLYRRTSLILDPPDGRLPPVTPAEQDRVAQRIDSYVSAANADVSIDSWEDLSAYDRCITRGMPGLMTPFPYNHYYQILQTPDYVAIVIEMIHDARIIPLDGRPRLPPTLRQWQWLGRFPRLVGRKHPGCRNHDLPRAGVRAGGHRGRRDRLRRETTITCSSASRASTTARSTTG